MAKRLLSSVALTCLVTLPAAGLAQQQGTEVQVAEECLQELRQIDRELVESGFGVYGAGRPTAAAPGAPGVPAGAGAQMLSSPRAQMRTVLQAGYVFAMRGDQEACQNIVSAVERIRESYSEAGVEATPEAREEWRRSYLEAAVPIGEVGGALRAEDLLGADVRNVAGEDLGDVEDVILQPQEGRAYALISRGGFLGIGEELIPVPWSSLRVSLSPYDTTVVLDVEEQALDEAPSLEQEEMARNQTWIDQVDTFWQEQANR